MEKTKKVSQPTPVNTEKITDQSTGPQQLYEDRKVRPSTKRTEPKTDPKKVRHQTHKKIDKLLGVGRVQRKTSTINKAKRT